MVQLLRDESIEPSDEVLASLLGDVYPVYERFISSITSDPLCLHPQWRYYRDVRAWLCKITDKKGTVSWMSIWEEFFKVTTYFPKKHVDDIDRLPINQEISTKFHETRLTRKNPYFSLDISRMEQIDDLLTIMAHKKKSR